MLKYVVYQQENTSPPQVDIWETSGEITHPIYAEQHGIKPQNISSEGYLSFNPLSKKWHLEHYQMDDGIPARTLGELVKKRRIEKRDRLLVKRKISQTDFLKDKKLQNQYPKLSLLRRIFQHD